MPAHRSFPSTATGPVRLTGAAYLVIILCGVWAEGFARAGLFFPGDPDATARAVLDNLPVFRASLLADAVMATADITVALLFFRLLRPHGEGLALAAMVFRLMQAGLIGASLILLAGVPVAAPDAPDTAQTLFAMHGTGYEVGLIFFGINSLFMMVLLARAGVPRLIAYGIGASGLVYLAGSLLRLIAPHLHTAIEPAYLVPLLAETALCLWLLIRGRF
ncbi:DUF4386 domain-containing protein [Anianabacter salinae]|uniref:DUF4386 domain-containing protein n=1 Tax=Anianabacter salinae TaxID=2851023 RepID=UPI00225E1D71|nr:DUF4386 domain-containing protein [Anianabacter salinae]MBV0912838.1 DUF4386 domain-containing protein [Anianabacter salinae]